MESFFFGRWQGRCDLEATRKAYAQFSTAGPEQCGCGDCRNFIAARDQIHTPDVTQLLEKLGIDHRREVEVYSLTWLESGLIYYGGWFHFVGTIEAGVDALRPN